MAEDQSDHTHDEAAGKRPRSWPTDDLVEIPPARRHNSGTAASISGVLFSLIVAIFGAAALGAGYGAFLALCGEKYVNISVSCAFPFWMHVPAQLGFWYGHVRNRKWRRRIELIGFVICIYAVCIGWIAGVLDGPGFVFHPAQIVRHLSDVHVHGIWVEGLGIQRELYPLAPYLLTLRFGSIAWILFGGLMTIGAEFRYPYCQTCRCWMDDDTKLRLQFEPTSSEDPKLLATQLVRGQYDELYRLDQCVKSREKGLELHVFSCERCEDQHVLNARWFRATPDPDKSPTEQLLESGTGQKLVSDLLVPTPVRTHLAGLARSKAA